MACYHPIAAWQPVEGGPLRFRPPVRRGEDWRPLKIACNQCLGCRIRDRAELTARCVHEAQMHEWSWFATFTYDDAHAARSLDYSDAQLLWKRVRKALGPFRLLTSGEYGELTGRAHWHALLFGLRLSDVRRFGGDTLHSAELERLWGKGFVHLGQVELASAQYVASYHVKKLEQGYDPVTHKPKPIVDVETGEILAPELSRRSLRPGLGYSWFDRYWSDVFPHDRVCFPGPRFHPVPAYYDVLCERKFPQLFEDVRVGRAAKSGLGQEDRTPARLAVRETCARAKLKFFAAAKL